MAPPRIIAGPADMEEGVATLVKVEPRFSAIAIRTGLPALRRAAPGFKGLLRIVTEQMISLKAAEAIWTRIEAELHPCDPVTVLGWRHEGLMKLGLTAHKARCFRALAEAVHGGSLPLERFEHLPDEEITRLLTALHGVGPWTAEIYLLSCLGRADVWPAGDVALMSAVQHAFGLEVRPDPRQMRQLAENWRPWRAVAARLLWAHYRLMRGLPQAED